MSYRNINLDDYANLIAERKKAKKHFRDMKVGNQLYEEANLRLFSPITTKISDESEKQISQSKEIQQAVQHLNHGLQRQIDQVEQLQEIKELPYYEEPVETEPITRVDFEQNLSDDDRQILRDELGLPLPNSIKTAAFANEILKIIKKKNKSLGQYTRQDNKKQSPVEKELYEKYKKTLKKYKPIVQTIADGAMYAVKGEGLNKKKKKLVKSLEQRGKRGRPKKCDKVIYYQNTDELLKLLDKYTSLKSAGHNNVDNYIVDILDELLNKRVIDISDYNGCFKKYFPDYIK